VIFTTANIPPLVGLFSISDLGHVSNSLKIFVLLDLNGVQLSFISRYCILMRPRILRFLETGMFVDLTVNAIH
jgi:hypothetical protein